MGVDFFLLEVSRRDFSLIILLVSYHVVSIRDKIDSTSFFSIFEAPAFMPNS